MVTFASIWNRFLVFTASLLICVGGGIYFLRMMADELSSVEATTENFLLLAAFWAIPIVTFLKFLLRAGFRETLTLPGAILVIIGYLEIIVFSILSYNIFFDKPAENILNRFVSFSEASSQLGTKLPIKIDDTLTLTALDFDKGTLTYHYDIANGIRPDADTLRERATKSSCGSLRYHLSHGLVAQVVHEYNYIQSARDPRLVAATTKPASDEPPVLTEGAALDPALQDDPTKMTQKVAASNASINASLPTERFIPPVIFSITEFDCATILHEQIEKTKIKGGSNVP